jgi:hypothetical protein
MPYMLGACNLRIGNAYTECQLFEVDTGNSEKPKVLYTLPLTPKDTSLIVLRPFIKKQDIRHENNLLYAGSSQELCSLNETWCLDKEKHIVEELTEMDNRFMEDFGNSAYLPRETADEIFAKLVRRECPNIGRKTAFAEVSQTRLPDCHGKVFLDKKQGLLSEPFYATVSIRKTSFCINILLHEIAHLIDYEKTRSLAHGPSFLRIYSTLLCDYLKDYEYEEIYKQKLEELSDI